MSELLTFQALAAFVTLTLMEIVLGIDNVVFVAILTGRLPTSRQASARRLGLGLAAIGRIALLFAVSWLVTLDKAVLFALFDHDITGKSLILIFGGVFLLGKATWEIHRKLEDGRGRDRDRKDPHSKAASFGGAITQILMLDLVFSIDSVLTAIGMVNPDEYAAAEVPATSIPWPPLVIMICAIGVSSAVMVAFSGPLSRFIEHHPTMKMLALSFLLLIGVILVAEGLGQHIARGYVYFAMGFSLGVELLNLKVIKRRTAKAAS